MRRHGWPSRQAGVSGEGWPARGLQAWHAAQRGCGRGAAGWQEQGLMRGGHQAGGPSWCPTCLPSDGVVVSAELLGDSSPDDSRRRGRSGRASASGGSRGRLAAPASCPASTPRSSGEGGRDASAAGRLEPAAAAPPPAAFLRSASRSCARLPGLPSLTHDCPHLQRHGQGEAAFAPIGTTSPRRCLGPVGGGAAWGTPVAHVGVLAAWDGPTLAPRSRGGCLAARDALHARAGPRLIHLPRCERHVGPRSLGDRWDSTRELDHRQARKALVLGFRTRGKFLTWRLVTKTSCRGGVLGR